MVLFTVHEYSTEDRSDPNVFAILSSALSVLVRGPFCVLAHPTGFEC